MRRPIQLLLLLFILVPATLAQGVAGTWTFSLVSPDGDAVGEGLLQLPSGTGDGRFALDGQGLDGKLTGQTTGSGQEFSFDGTLAMNGGAIPFKAAGRLTSQNAFDGAFTIGGQEIPAKGERAPMDAFAARDAEAQAAADARPDIDMFEPFDMPTPNSYRSASGRPGPDYWQQRADYTLDVSIEPTTHTVTGTVTLRYTNNSPEALTFLWFQLEQNLFQEGSRGGPVSGRASSSLSEDHGYRLGNITAGGRRVTPLVTDTRMRLDLPTPVAAKGGTVEVVIPYTFVVPGSPRTPRMGRMETAAGTMYAMAQWYPRVTVFDDVNGWNNLPYLGSGEFYLNYGDYELNVTVPSDMQVVATGALQNPNDVYSPTQRDRLAQARQSDTAVMIVPAVEVGQTGGTRGASKTWRFKAENVRDVAFGASAAYMVDGARAAIPQADGTTNNVLILSAYPTEGLGTPDSPGWEEATRYGRASILNNSYWYPYPYPVAISVASHVGGMEYPMLHFSSVRSRHKSLFGVIDHELGHNWYPMIVGSDERRHAWMDEGFNTFINGPSGITFYNEGSDPSLPGYGEARAQTGDGIARGLMNAANSVDDELLTYADQLDGREGGWNSYSKPGAGLELLRNAILGQERFDTAFREYTRRWAYKHPQPSDFFRTMEDVSGEDLDWFWRGWFDTVETFDASLTRMASTDESVFVTVAKGKGLVFPSTVLFTFADGTTQEVDVPVEAFAKADTLDLSIPLNGRAAVSAELDPHGLLPDGDRSNNIVTPTN